MIFEEYWAEVEKLKLLPKMVIQQLPSALSQETKKRLIRERPKEIAELINTAISEINRGSIESIGSLVQKRI